MIGKVLRGRNVRRLLYYLYGPGLANEHADPHLVANFEPVVVPGLLQTEEYARQMSRGGPRELDRDDIERRIQVRMERQRILAREDRPRLWAVVDEAVIRRVVGSPEVMREQLRHLIDTAEQGKTTFQVVPFNAGAHAGTTGPFIIVDFPEPAPDGD